MTYRPKSQGNKEKLLSLLFALFAVLLIITSGIINRFGGLYQISAIVFGVVSIEFYLKYVGSDYIYDAADDYFRVYKVTGKKSICVSSLDYEMSLSLVVNKSEYENDREKFPKVNFNVNLCKNLAPKEYSVYFFRFNGKNCMMKFEPDEAFARYLNNKISASLEKTEYDFEE